MIESLVIGLALALLLGMAAQKLHLSPLVGYLLAGVIAGSPQVSSVDNHTVEEFSHVGIVLLLFGVGLHFHFKDLLAVQRVALPGSVLNMLLHTVVGGAIFYAFTGCGWAAAAMFGVCFSVASTVVLTRVLEDNRVLHTPSGHTALGWLVVEDIFTIVLLVLLPALVSGGSVGMALLGMALKLVALVICVAYVGKYVIHRVLTYLARSASGEMFTLAVLVFAMGIAVLSSHVFGASMEFGAFLSGMVLGQSRFAARAASEALPMRDAFAVLFFVSVGMSFDWHGMVEQLPLVLAMLGFTIIFKPLTVWLSVLLLRKPMRMAVLVAGSFSQVGEFSFILGALAAGEWGLLDKSAVNVITAVAIISITLNPLLYRLLPGLIRVLEQRGIGQGPAPAAVPPPEESRYRSIVVGYGPCGEMLTRILRDHGMDVVVLEMNIDTVNSLCRAGIPALHGDARSRSVLQAAGCEQAKAIIVTSSAVPAQEIASAARSLNPGIEVLAQTHYIRDARKLRSEGARNVISGEEEAAITMGVTLLRSLGATEEQVMQERRQLRRTLSP
ncbi:MAG: cation:proton antiporter [Akkermansia sp.]|nr:cation:proton antiporter [Akkermansia sp.]